MYRLATMHTIADRQTRDIGYTDKQTIASCVGQYDRGRVNRLKMHLLRGCYNEVAYRE